MTAEVTQNVGAGERPRQGSLWAWAGALAGLAGVAAVQASGAVTAAYDEKAGGDAVKVGELFAEQRTPLVAMHLLLMAATVLLLVFAAGLWRRLRSALPEDSLLAPVAAFGLVLTSAVTLIGGGLDTELIFGLGDLDKIGPEFALVGAHWVGTLPWLWIGAGVSGVAVAVASLRHRAVARWLGWTSLLVGGLTLLLGISPLQYMAGFTGPVWVLIAGLGLALSRPARG